MPGYGKMESLKNGGSWGKFWWKTCGFEWVKFIFSLHFHPSLMKCRAIILDSGFLLLVSQVQTMIRVSAFPKKAAAKPKKQAIVISEDEDGSSQSKPTSKSRVYSSDEDNSEVIIQC